MKKSKKIVSILMIIITLIANFSCLLGKNSVEAAILPIEKADLYSKGEVILFDYENVEMAVEIIVYEKDGIEYPAYGLNKGKQGITQNFKYSVNINELLTNQKIYRAIINGYPFKTPEELGCNNVSEAYVATKIAVNDARYNYNLDKFTIHDDSDSSKRTVAAINKIITAARNSTETKIAAVLKIQEEGEEWQVDAIDKNYISKTYSVKAVATNKTYQINIKGENVNRFKITDLNNKEKVDFEKSESFKILLPISDLEKSGEFTIQAKSLLETKPILFGETSNPEWQNFAIITGVYEVAETTLKQNYKENKTTIEVIKLDGDTKKPLANAIFNLLDEKKQLLHAELTTNVEGIVQIDYLLPGSYYLEETIPPEGYYGYNELIPINIDLQEKVVITIDNFEDLGKKEVPKPPKESKYFVEKKLPRTGS